MDDNNVHARVRELEERISALEDQLQTKRAELEYERRLVTEYRDATVALQRRVNRLRTVITTLGETLREATRMMEGWRQA
jgi:vacuolar-type H+-ATPase subunit I/STV1